MPDDEPTHLWTWKDILLITFGVGVIFLIGYLAVFILPRLAETPDPTDLTITLAMTIAAAALEGVAILGGVYIFGFRRRRLPPSAIGLRKPTLSWLFWSAFLGIIAIPVSGLIALLVQVLLQAPIENTQLDFLLPSDLNPFGMLVLVLFIGLILPFAEELYFRGVLYKWFRNRWGYWISAGISSLIFALVHADLAVGVTAFLLGMLMAWVYEKSQSLWSAVLIHAINNSSKIILVYILVLLGLLPK